MCTSFAKLHYLSFDVIFITISRLFTPRVTLSSCYLFKETKFFFVFVLILVVVFRDKSSEVFWF